MSALLKTPLLPGDVLHHPVTGGYLLVTGGEDGAGAVGIALAWVRPAAEALRGMLVWHVDRLVPMHARIPVALLHMAAWESVGRAVRNTLVSDACRKGGAC